MRARELLDEDYNQSLQTDLENLLMVAKGSGAYEIKTAQVVQQLRNMGYAVDANSLIPILSSNPAVMQASPKSISITRPVGSGVDIEDPGEDSAEKVDDMAQKATKIG